MTVLVSTLEKGKAKGKRENSSITVSMYRFLVEVGNGPLKSKLNRSKGWVALASWAAEYGKFLARTKWCKTCDTRVTQRGMDIMKCSPIHASAVNSRKRIWSRVKLSRAINNIEIKLIKLHAPTQHFVVFNFPTVLSTVHKWNWPLVHHNCKMTSSQEARPFPDSFDDGQGFLFHAGIVQLTFVQHSREGHQIAQDSSTGNQCTRRSKYSMNRIWRTRLSGHHKEIIAGHSGCFAVRRKPAVRDFREKLIANPTRYGPEFSVM